jgi:hypothetical protein
MKKAVSYAEGMGGDDIACPNCGNGYLHQGTVHVFHRAKEDADSERIIIEGDKVKLDDAGSNDANPSARRQGLVVDFTCEHCNAHPQLCLAQHKGATELFWRNYGAR